MTEKFFTTVKELLFSDVLPKKLRYLLSLILFFEFIIIITSKLFPLNNFFLSLYPQGIATRSIYILEIFFYFSFTLSWLYSFIFFIVFILNILLEKHFESDILKVLLHGCSLRLCDINEFLLIVSIPLLYFNTQPLIKAWINHPLSCILIATILFVTLFPIMADIINNFFIKGDVTK